METTQNLTVMDDLGAGLTTLGAGFDDEQGIGGNSHMDEWNALLALRSTGSMYWDVYVRGSLFMSRADDETARAIVESDLPVLVAPHRPLKNIS